METELPPASPRKGRGATFNPKVRFESTGLDPFDDGWGSLAELHAETPPPATEVRPDASRSVIVRNASPDIPFEQSINPYRGCEHGCIYCYARPSHAYLGLSPGLDFETKIYAKLDAAPLLERELARPGYRCQPIALGSNTDPYQPQERKLGITRGILEVLGRYRHPVTIVTKSAAVTRDLDLLATHGRGWPGGRRDLDHDARCRARPHPRAARGGAAPSSRSVAQAQRRGRADERPGRADHPGSERPASSRPCSRRPRRLARVTRATSCSACRTS